MVLQVLRVVQGFLALLALRDRQESPLQLGTEWEAAGTAWRTFSVICKVSLGEHHLFF